MWESRVQEVVIHIGSTRSQAKKILETNNISANRREPVNNRY